MAQRQGTAPCSPVRAQRVSQQTLLGPGFSKESSSFQTGARGNLLYKCINFFLNVFLSATDGSLKRKVFCFLAPGGQPWCGLGVTGSVCHRLGKERAGEHPPELPRGIKGASPFPGGACFALTGPGDRCRSISLSTSRAGRANPELGRICHTALSLCQRKSCLGERAALLYSACTRKMHS